MKNIEKYIDLLHNENVCQYLALNQWHELTRLFDGRVRQFISPDEDYAILIPLIKDFCDYYKVMNDSLIGIAKFEGTSLRSLLNILLNPTSDIMKWRIANDNTALGAISFNTMFDNIESIRNLLASTYKDILSPSTFHKRIMVTDVQEQIATYKFGQTEIGSYILNLVSPLGYYQYRLFDPQEEELPINRRINLKMLSSINQIQQSVQDNNSILDEKVASGDISVNFLNSLTKIYEDNKDSEVSIGAMWDIKIPTIIDNPINELMLYPRCAEKVAQTAEKYTPKQEQNVPKTYYGKITNIFGDAEIDNREKLTVTIATIGEDNQRLSVKVELDNSQYAHIVSEAFENGANIKASGTFMAQARTVKLIEATIQILD